MVDLSSLVQETCDFCECGWDEGLDEPLTPLFVGAPDSKRQAETSRSNSSNGRGFANSTTMNRYSALVEALRKNSSVEFEISDGVYELEGSVVAGEEMSQSYNADKTVAEVSVAGPPPEEREPDAMVCEECAEMFSSLGE